jgi:hypothetical protein
VIKSKVRRANPEELLQRAVVNLLLMYETQKRLTFTCTNNNVPRSGVAAMAQQKKARLSGVRKGFPDMTCFLFEKPPFFMELKSPTGTGRLSPDQKVWRDRLQAMGFDWFLIRSIDDVKAALKQTGVI